MVEKITVHKTMSDSEIADREGEYFSEKFYKGVGRYIVKSDVDVYTSEGKLLLKFRKKIIPKHYTDMALDSFLEASQKKHVKIHPRSYRYFVKACAQKACRCWPGFVCFEVQESL